MNLRDTQATASPLPTTAFIVAWLLITAGCTGNNAGTSTAAEAGGDGCTEADIATLAARVKTDDGQGHGPDIGSEEWQSVVEFKLGLRGAQGIPTRGSRAWCQRMLAQHPPGPVTPATAPAFDCNRPTLGSIETLICSDEELSALDQQLAAVYQAARSKAGAHLSTLTAEQRGWIKGRDACWQADNARQCTIDSYHQRRVELQAHYRLVPHRGPVYYACDGNAAKEVVATYFQTDPPTLIAEFGDQISLMQLQPSASGARYTGRNESLWEHQGEARIVWGYNAEAMLCRKK